MVEDVLNFVDELAAARQFWWDTAGPGLEGIRHPLVEAYLAEFDRAAAALPIERRLALRDSIAEHLGELVPPTASAAEAQAVIADFGAPAEIVAQEAEVETVPPATVPAVPHASPVPSRRRGLGASAIVLIVIGALLALFVVMPALGLLAWRSVDTHVGDVHTVSVPSPLP